MSETKNVFDVDREGGPAFPQTWSLRSTEFGDQLSWPGISMRDYFAAAALIGLVEIEGGGHARDSAQTAYRIADAMIEARKT
jgi:hypothetical protein